jgi:superfamily II DNA or RNA helicase
MPFAVGSLVRARGREWVVLPESNDQLILVRPLGGTEEESTGILTALEEVASATFDLPGKKDLGDFRSSRLLRDAIRIGFRSSAGPFRSFGRIAVEPRPYQLVPLLMALRLDPIRMLIADDVGIGKTVEASLIARELIDRGEAKRLAVLCPPHLAEQWQEELATKFHIDAELVLPSTAARLERQCATNQSLFERFPYVIVSMDYIKSETRRSEFIRSCPELVLVDEAHTCAFTAAGRSGRHQRYQLLKELSTKNPNRHLILITATPHSGNEEAFRSLLSILDPELQTLPMDLTGEHNVEHRRKLARLFVQRRRGDIKSYMGSETLFPQRIEKEETYKLSPEYKNLFGRVLAYARETVLDAEGGLHKQRVRWWSALALLRALASSPAAAQATLLNRASTAETITAEEANEVGRQTVLDLEGDDSERGDVTPGSDFLDTEDEQSAEKQRLRDLAKQAEQLKGIKDTKLLHLVGVLEQLIKEACCPIVFCRFVDTAEYLAEELRKRMPKDVDVSAVTGLLPPVDREERVRQLAKSSKRILVCTDCLSEGINLQKDFDTVIHYDLSWNPTRHEQREGRVDRFGQPRDKVRVVTYYGTDNQIDGIVLDVLIRKHKTIRSSLGISVPVPADTNQVVEAIFEGLLLRGKPAKEPEPESVQLKFFEEYIAPHKQALYDQWEIAADRERRSHQSMFAQQTIRVEDVARELEEARKATGFGMDVKSFVVDGLRAHKAVISGQERINVELRDVPRALVEAIGQDSNFAGKFEPPVEKEEILLTRTHSIVEGLAHYVMSTALDSVLDSIAKRAGVIRTKHVDLRTTLLILRGRYHIMTTKQSEQSELLAEDCVVAAFRGAPEKPEWLPSDKAESLLSANVHANIAADLAGDFIDEVVASYAILEPSLNRLLKEHADQLLDAHRRVRVASNNRGIRYDVRPQSVDVLGIYIFLPEN